MNDAWVIGMHLRTRRHAPLLLLLHLQVAKPVRHEKIENDPTLVCTSRFVHARTKRTSNLPVPRFSRVWC